jgi:hypothetical protein
MQARLHPIPLAGVSLDNRLTSNFHIYHVQGARDRSATRRPLSHIRNLVSFLERIIEEPTCVTT